MRYRKLCILLQLAGLALVVASVFWMPYLPRPELVFTLGLGLLGFHLLIDINTNGRRR